jgi:hypothetical protein
MKENIFENAVITYVLLAILGFIQMYSVGMLSSDGFVLAGQIMGRPTVPLINSLIFVKITNTLSKGKQLVVMLVVGVLSTFLIPSAFVLILALLLLSIDLLLGVFRRKEKPSQQ